MVSKLIVGHVVASVAGVVFLSCAGVSNADSWAQQADSACSTIYASMGRASSAGNAGDKLALFEYWHAKVLSRTADTLRSIPGSSQEGMEYADGIDFLSQLEQQDAAVSAKGGLSLDLTRKIRLVSGNLKARAEALSVPTCDQIVNF